MLARVWTAVLFTLLLATSFCSHSHGTNLADGNSLGLVLGYGTSHPGWGDTTERVETLDFAFRYENPSKKIGGRSWYRYRHSFTLETPLHLIIPSRGSFMFGISFLSRWAFQERDNMKPYLLIGGGPVYSFANIEGMSSKINGSYQGGMGLEFSVGGRQCFLDIRFHHVSNGGVRKPNVPLNSSKILFAIGF